MYKICDNIIITDMNGDLVASRRNDPAGNILIVFNDVGQLIVRHIMKNHPVEMIVDDLHQKTAVGVNTIRSDLFSFIDTLVAGGIIETCG